MLNINVPASWYISSNSSVGADIISCSTYPLVSVNRLRDGYEAFNELGIDAVLECQKYGHPPRRRFTLTKGYVEHDIISAPTELLEDMYHDAGTFMFSTYHALDRPLADRNIKWLPVKEWEAQDIDCIDDWNMLELKYRGLSWDSRG